MREKLRKVKAYVKRCVYPKSHGVQNESASEVMISEGREVKRSEGRESEEK